MFNLHLKNNYINQLFSDANVKKNVKHVYTLKYGPLMTFNPVLNRAVYWQ